MNNKTYHITTIGCQMNKSDSARIANYLEELGYQAETNRFKAQLVIFTTCGVRQSAEDRIYGLIPKVKINNPQATIVLTGCLVNRPDVRKRLADRVDIWLPITELVNFAEQLGEKKKSIDQGSYAGYLSLQSKYDSDFSAYVPIGNGCNNFCTYCVVPYARGPETYRPFTEIIAEVKKLLALGYKEITLIAQNVNSYRSENYDFPDLLEAVANLEGDFWLRFATSHPKDMSMKLIEVIKNNPKICPHVHLPVQAGDNEVLRRMNRKYTVEHYLDLITKIKQAISNVALTTDIIVGFPGETKEQFEQTKKLFEIVKYDMAYIAQYSPRYGTPAFKMKDDVSQTEKKRREQELMKVLRKTAENNNQKYLGQEVEVLVNKQKNNHYFGQTKTSKTVKFTGQPGLVGKIVIIKIKQVSDFGLEGDIIEVKQ